MSFKTTYFCLSATSSTSHKHDLLCSTRWLENTNIPLGLYLFLWIIPILFTLISSLLWWINYWHFWCSIFLLICSSFFHFPQLTTQFHYHLCVLSFTLILQLLNAPVLWCWSFWNTLSDSISIFDHDSSIKLFHCLPLLTWLVNFWLCINWQSSY